MSDILAELEWRGLYADCTDRDALAKRLAEGPTTLYCGFDPTADSLHVGNLVPLFALRRFQQYGHLPIALAGGATGMVGDPSGKSDERNLLTPDQLQHNLDCIKPQLARFLDFSGAKNPARLVNNYDWTGSVTFLEFLRDIGKHITVNSMTAKDSVRSRMEDRSTGISFTEFSYMLLQGHDFYHLRKTFNCELQVGATDQWGNITVGTELTRKKLGATVWGLVFPLLTKADGSKYGKTATGTVWLDAKKTSPYRFYQFFVNADDADVVKLLKTLTFLPQDEITALEKELKANPGARAAQKALAKEMTVLVHGAEALAAALKASEILFGGSLDGITEDIFNDVAGEVPTKDLEKVKLEGTGSPIADLIVHSGLESSKGAARKALEAGGIYLNNVRVPDHTRAVTSADLLFGKYLLLRKGKKSYAVLTAK
ncbi:tyrosine--tRNA ligase [Opitutus sp. GAS368]|jgi:tyrosyl-tRNA synthetase|uniref:tyrosine--tRNA ligase n=1 Tax=Opitutus sp. GAS368 TaxID=1882749 RepID=UPI00087CF87C|nr:tyrosine--tRNA ligase [Opitutus sp. GAS368]SDR65453.1 tyrosyl-tRNA synthetase [Opitutus sp. GAS368]